jgi:complement component 1 Q subcomponent-binding protein, mitochondrial
MADTNSLFYCLIYCSELPVNVCKDLLKFLEQGGITLSTTNYMHDYMVTKQTQEYVRWMTKLKDFVKQ